MKLNPTGKIVADEWIKSQKIRDRVQLGEWVVMPNHIHGIIYLKPKQRRDASHAFQNKKNKKTDGRGPFLQSIGNSDYKNKFGPQRNNISSIARGFKSACTRKIIDNGTENFGWQSGFYDHIIQDEESLIKIEQYIQENPYRWNKDKYYC